MVPEDLEEETDTEWEEDLSTVIVVEDKKTVVRSGVVHIRAATQPGDKALLRGFPLVCEEGHFQILQDRMPQQ